MLEEKLSEVRATSDRFTGKRRKAVRTRKCYIHFDETLFNPAILRSLRVEKFT
ncbi:hypothetical protein SAMD00020551_0212 [Mesobacillus selenatarsenatis SF-1]|uniref:Uncharacterized protein n=1 Tax=Mesobacillus selenatarsenatis (strain DSM 18680 / JCM 14380 / FERM P-15431 / SF-1) TaxID=1321606 RepID=A0A0A8WWU6_MESS1|nr:hypothetical protein SAMD00020551_0212 [Mesobacillus selenatarsenatis SF-1]